MTMNQLLDALGRHRWACVYDKEQRGWCLWHDGKCILTSGRVEVMALMRSCLNDWR